MPDNRTMEQRVADARNGDNLLDVVNTLEALDGHSYSSRAFRELATPLIQQVIEDVKPALLGLKNEHRRKGQLAKRLRKEAKKPKPAPEPKPAPVEPPADLPPLDADAVGAMNFADLKALWDERKGDADLPKGANNRVSKQSIIDALLAE